MSKDKKPRPQTVIRLKPDKCIHVNSWGISGSTETLRGRCGRCNQIQSFSKRGDYQEHQDLRTSPRTEPDVPPAEFMMEEWTCLDDKYPWIKWKGTKKIHYKGVHWNYANCTDDDSMCQGEANLSFTSREEQDWDGPEITLNNRRNSQYPYLYMAEDLCLDSEQKLTLLEHDRS
jgi:hypothetical protein